jgi:hypothetical protein
VIRDLAQAIFFGAWFVLLFRYRPLRDLIRAAPRYLTIPVGLFTLAWLAVQLTDQRARYFPIVSVYMYGEYRPMPEQSAIGVRGTWCNGTGDRLDLKFMGRASFRSRIELLHEGLAFRRTAADSAKRWDIIDRSLRAIGGMYNSRFPDRPLCAIGLEEVRLSSDQYRSGVIPPARVIHDVALR